MIKNKRPGMLYNNFFLSSFQNIKNDRAVTFGILNKVWLFLSAFINVPFLIIFLTPALQGYYYTFSSILGLQTIFLLGMGQLIQQFVSHEWAKIKYDPESGLTGEQSSIERLSSIKNFTLKWYSWLTAILFIGLFIGGYLFIKDSPPKNIINVNVWFLPWLVICILKSIQILISPGITFLDGINEVAPVNKFRFEQSIMERSVSWLVLIIGGNLWLFAAGALVNISGQVVFLKRKYLSLFKHIGQLKKNRLRIWRSEIFPLQWRFAVSSLAGYLYFSFLVPLVFWYLGPVEAGKLGITWAIITMFWNLAVTPIAAAMPSLAGFAAKNDFLSFKKYLRQPLINSIVLLLGGIIILYAGLIFLNVYFSSTAGRFLDLLTSAIFLLAIIPHHLRFLMISYMRALKKDPFWFISISESILLLFIFFIFSKHSGFFGLSLGFLTVSILSCCINYLVFKKLIRIENKDCIMRHGFSDADFTDFHKFEYLLIKRTKVDRLN